MSLTFPRSFFDRLDDDLTRSVRIINQTLRKAFDARLITKEELTRRINAADIEENMGVSEIKERLKNIAGSHELSMSYGPQGSQVFHLGGKSVELSGMATDDEIVTALQANLQKIDAASQSIRDITTKMAKSPLQGLGQKLGLAKHNAELDAQKISTKVDELEARRAAATPKVLAGLEAQGQDIGELETFVADLEKATNG